MIRKKLLKYKKGAYKEGLITKKIKAVMQRWRLKEKDTSYLNKRVVVVDTLLDVTIGFFSGMGVATLDIKYMCAAGFSVMCVGIFHRILKLKYYSHCSK